MKLLCWTPLTLAEKKFPRSGDKAFVPAQVLRNAFINAFVYYSLKKDKALEKRVEKFLLEEDFTADEAVRFVEEEVFKKNPRLENLKVSDAPLSTEKVVNARLVLLDLKKQEDIKSFVAEVYTGSAPLEIEFEDINHLRSACHSFAEALAHAELTLVRDHPLADTFYRPLMGELKNWFIPLRTGYWCESPLEEKLFWFWGNKPVRERVRRLLGRDIRPRRVLYYPRERQTLGWTEVISDV